MVSLHHAAVRRGDSQHSCPGVPWTHTTTPSICLVQHEVLLMESGFLGKRLLAASPPATAAQGWGPAACQHPAGREMAAISRWARGGCVGWESFSGALCLAGLTSKASLDVRRW